MRWTQLRRWAFAAGILFYAATLSAQGFTFNCTKDTTIGGCSPNPCFTLRTVIPDLHGLTGDYTVNGVGTSGSCFPVYSSPEIVGTPTALTIDDRYSAIIPIGFAFPFYGNIYNDLIVSTNGVVCFQTSLDNDPAHWQILQSGNPVNLPSTFYDPALIMGPYHDLNPNVAQPSQRIDYITVGAAPYRKWILNFYRVPLFGPACVGLIENTHQIVLYESTGVIEVLIYSKQACTGWNQGRAMVGIQNFNRDRAVMAPGRAASDPPWGTPGMNEAWRFVPNEGPSLFRRVELYNATGITLLATGTTTNLGNGNLEAAFPNICPPSGATTTYIVKSFYSKIDNPLEEVMGVDTIRITKGPPTDLNATATTSPSACGPPSGSITVTVPSGTAPYTYIVDGGAPSTGGSPRTFNNMAPGPHTIVVTDASGVCNSTINVTVAQDNNLQANLAPTGTSCPGVNNGTLTATPTNGIGPYTFTLSPLALVQIGATANYTNLPAGSYTLTIADASGCSSPGLPVVITQGAGLQGNINQTATSCAGGSDGSVTVNPTNGTGPYQFILDGGAATQIGNTATFNGLPAGAHTVMIVDANGCASSPALSINVGAGPPLTSNVFTTATSCAGANNGTATFTPIGGTGPYTFVLDGGAATQTGATTTTFTNLSPGGHTVTITDAGGCASNIIPISITSGAQLTTSVNHTDVLCFGGSTGTITVTAPAGPGPFEYSLDGTNWQASNVFNGLPAATYTVYFRDIPTGCQGQLTRTVAQPAALAATSAGVPVVCNGQSNGTITITTTGGAVPYQYSINGGTSWQASNVFNVPAGAYTVTIRDANNCTTTQSLNITEPDVLTATTAQTNATCNGGNDGRITVTASGGNSNFTYSIDATSFQASNVFNVAPGTYTVTIKDNLGCTFTVPNVVVNLTDDLTYTAPPAATICEGSSTQLQVVSNALQYSWAPATGLSSPSVANPIASPTTTTNYIVTVTYGRCSADIPVTINVNAAPVPNAGADGFICYGQTYQLQASGGVNYKWTPPLYLSDPNIPNPIVTPDRTTTYSLSVTDANGCPSLISDDVTVDVTPPIKVTTFPFDTVTYEGDQFQMLATSVATDYIWTPTTGLSNPAIPNPVVTAGAVGDMIIYKVTASTQAGCKGEGFVRLRVYKGPELYTPTAFTPNGDGKNDKFYPFPVGISEIKYFKVFNRWGQLLFSTTRVNDGWDGRSGGVEQASGVYVWRAEAVTEDNKVISKQGTVVLIR